MAMNVTTLWPINGSLFINGQIIKHVSQFGTTMAFPILVKPIHIPWSLSPMMNPHFFKMTKGWPVGTIKTASQPLDQKVIGNCWWSWISWWLSGNTCVMAAGVSFLFLVVLSIDHSAERLTLCSNQGRTMVDTLVQENSSPRSIMQSISLSTRQMALLRGSSCLTMHPVTRSVLMTPFLPPRWSKVHSFVFFTFFCLINVPRDPKCLWTHHPKGPCMHDGVNPSTGKPQSFYFPDNHPNYLGWFKGMEQIIHEHGLWPKAGLPSKCTGHKHAKEGQATCCYHHLLYSQPNFTSQKALLQEYIELCGHLCDFYPKYHCELNFIEQYWGTAKLQFHIAGCVKTLNKMERKMLNCLDFVPFKQIQRCISTSFLFQVWNISLQICRQVCMLYFHLSSRSVQCLGSIGQQEIPWPLHSPPGYDCDGEGNGPKVILLISYMYILWHICILGHGPKSFWFSSVLG